MSQHMGMADATMTVSDQMAEAATPSFGGPRNLKSMHSGSRASIRDKLRQECINRVKKDRMNLMSRLRTTTSADPSGHERMMVFQGFAKDVIAGVQVGDGDSHMSLAETVGGDDDFLDFMRRLEEDLVAEMMQQEEEIVRQHLEQQQQEDHALFQAIESNEVICPVCMRAPVFKNANVFFCSCGMRLSLASDQLSLEQLRSSITTVFSEHGKHCHATPGTAVQSCGGYDMLVMACSCCEFMDIIA